MKAASGAFSKNNGPLGHVSFLAALLLLLAAPLMRGGNRQVALIALEAIALVFLLALWTRTLSSGALIKLASGPLHGLSLALLLSSPLWLSLAFLIPVPSETWFAAPGRSLYQHLLNDAGIKTGDWLPLSLVPDATRASLLAGIPLVAGFLAGYFARLPQLKVMLWLVVSMAFAQILMGLLQIAGGPGAGLHFGMDAGDRAIGTFANPNHYGDYIAMALAAYCWLGWGNLERRRRRNTENSSSRFTLRHAMSLWVAGGLVLVLGILVSRSRGAALTGLPAAMIALAVVSATGGSARGWRKTGVLLGFLLAGAVALVGLDSVLTRFELSGMATSAIDRGLLTSSTMEGARAFWPLGAGWGTYGFVYPRFQPPAITGFADYAHNDYAQMLFEGGIFAVVLAAPFVWLVASRALALTRSAIAHRTLSQEEMACAICGLGLLGLLAHSFMEFNLHIPANAILGALLAGVFLRPLEGREAEGAATP